MFARCELCGSRFVLIATTSTLVTILVIATFHINRSVLQANRAFDCPAKSVSLSAYPEQFNAVIVFGVASVYHQVLELTRVLQHEGIKATEVTSVETLNTGFNDILYILLAPQLVVSYPKHFIAYQVEQWGSPWITSPWGVLQANDRPSNYQEVLGAALEVWDYSRWNIQHFDYPDSPRGVERCQVSDRLL